MTQAPDVAALRAKFGPALERSAVSNGDHIVWVAKARAHEILAWLKTDQGYAYLVDITAVEYRDPELPLEVVWTVRNLKTVQELRVKVGLDPKAALAVDSVVGRGTRFRIELKNLVEGDLRRMPSRDVG